MPAVTDPAHPLPPLALGIDIGTSSVKALVCDARGRVVAEASSLTPILTPPEVAPLGRAMDPPQVLRALRRVVRQVLSSCPPEAVAVVGLTSMRQGIALLDRDGREVYLGPNIDLRAVFEGAALDEEHGEAVYRITGHGPSFLLPWGRLVWLGTHRPEAYERVAVLLPLADWLAYRATGVQAAEAALAGEAGLLDIRERRWAGALARTLGLRDDWFPPLAPALSVRGRVTREGSARLGVPPGVPVVVAGPDAHCALWAAGVRGAGQMGVVLGWSTPVHLLTPRPCPDPRRRTWVGLALEGDLWTAEANAGDGGHALSWVARHLYGSGGRSWKRMGEEAARAGPGSGGVVGLLGPTALDLSRPGMRTGGWLLPIPLSYSGVGRGHLARAALENIAFAVRACVELLEEVGGEKGSPLHVAGGGLRLGLFPPLLAAALNRPVLAAPHPSTSALGAALIGLKALNLLEGLPPPLAYTPDPGEALVYASGYATWREAGERLSHLPRG